LSVKNTEDPKQGKDSSFPRDNFLINVILKYIFPDFILLVSRITAVAVIRDVK
jgi:hypothetical protein